MFGFGKVGGLNRSAYNDCVRNCLEKQIQIETHRDKNPLFFSIFRAVDPLYAGWKLKLPPEETAMFIGLEYMGAAMRGNEENILEAMSLLDPLAEYLNKITGLGLISEDRRIEYCNGMENIAIEARSNARVQEVIVRNWSEE